VKILIISDTFSPDETAGANLLKDLANDLKKKNFLTIICARNKNFKDIINKNFKNYKKLIYSIRFKTNKMTQINMSALS